MLFAVLHAEVLKCKRTLVSWLSLVGGFFPVFVALLFLLTSRLDVTWETLASTSLNYLNMLSLLFIAIFAGHTFAAEYRDSPVNMTFAYPVPRFLLYAAKLLAVVLPVAGMFLAYALFAAVAGFIFAGGPPRQGFAGDYACLLPLSAALSFALVPVTAIVTILTKNAGAYILAGIGYFVLYMGFAGSDEGRFVPPCMPDRLLRDYLASGNVFCADTGGMLLACAAVFVLAFVLGGLCYTKWEI